MRLVSPVTPRPGVTDGRRLLGSRTITGTLTGSSIENEDNLAFSIAADVKPMTEVLPLAQAPAACERMMAGAARMRIVLEAG